MNFNIEDSVFTNHDENSIKRIAIRWGGIAGDGLQTMGILFAKYLNKLGYFSMGFPGTQSTIRGGHIWFHLELSDQKFYFYDRKIDILIAFNDQSIAVYISDLKSKGVLIINSDSTSTKNFDTKIKKKNLSVFKIPLTSYNWFKDRVYDLAKSGHNFTNLTQAFKKSLELDDKIPIGLFYQNKDTIYEPNFNPSDSSLSFKHLNINDEEIFNIFR